MQTLCVQVSAFQTSSAMFFDVEDSVETLLRQSCQFTYVEVNRELSGGTGMSPSAYGAYYDDQVPEFQQLGFHGASIKDLGSRLSSMTYKYLPSIFEETQPWVA